jgi:hypothetical protein
MGIEFQLEPSRNKRLHLNIYVFLGVEGEMLWKLIFLFKTDFRILDMKAYSLIVFKLHLK